MSPRPAEVSPFVPATLTEFDDFSGGLNLQAAKHLVRPNQVIDCLNMRLDRIGNYYIKRDGASRDNATAISANGITGLFRYYQNSTTKFILCANAADIYKDDGAGAYASIQAGLTSGAEVYFSSGLIGGANNAFAVNSNQAPKKWAGTGSMSNLGGTPPTGTLILIHKNFMFLAKAGGRVDYSDLADFETWPVNNFFNLITGRGEDATGFAVLNDALIIFTRSTIWRWVGSSNDDFRLENVSMTVGAVNQRSISVGNNEVFFASPDRMVYSLQGDMPIPMGFDVLPALQGVPASQLTKLASIFHDNYYYLAYTSTGSTNNRVLGFDALKRVWVFLYDWPLSCLFAFAGTGDAGELYGGQSSNGFVLKLNATAKDWGTTIKSKLQTRYEDHGMAQREKRWRRGWLTVDPFNGTLVTTYGVEYDRITGTLGSQSLGADADPWDVMLWDVGKWGGQTEKQYGYRFPSGVEGLNVSLTIENTDGDEQYSVYGYALEAVPRPMRIR